MVEPIKTSSAGDSSRSLAEHWFLSGPTASGKSAVALELARTLDAEIVSMDSMAVFRGMDIGTAKPSVEERAAVPHYLIDVVEPHEDFSLAEYLELAERVCADVTARGKKVLFVGGTPLYLKAILRGVFAGPPADWSLRERLQTIANSEGATALHRQLETMDSLAAARLNPNDARRVIRAIEVFTITRKSIVELQQQFENARPAEACRVFVLDWSRETLVERINQRVDAMFAAGWIDEVRTLLSRPNGLGRTASQAVGYKEIGEYLRGERELPETIELVKQRTRQFAKRQMTWFRSLSECRWIPLAHPFNAAEIAGRISQTA
jgi:tRNA dimethylallyltransferase